MYEYHTPIVAAIGPDRRVHRAIEALANDSADELSFLAEVHRDLTDFALRLDGPGAVALLVVQGPIENAMLARLRTGFLCERTGVSERPRLICIVKNRRRARRLRGCDEVVCWNRSGAAGVRAAVVRWIRDWRALNSPKRTRREAGEQLSLARPLFAMPSESFLGRGAGETSNTTLPTTSRGSHGADPPQTSSVRVV